MRYPQRNLPLRPDSDSFHRPTGADVATAASTPHTPIGHLRATPDQDRVDESRTTSAATATRMTPPRTAPHPSPGPPTPAIHAAITRVPLHKPRQARAPHTAAPQHISRIEVSLLRQPSRKKPQSSQLARTIGLNHTFMISSSSGRIIFERLRRAHEITHCSASNCNGRHYRDSSGNSCNDS